MTYTHITENERRSIERFLGDGRSRRYIAEKLSRSVGTISEEITENSVKGVYDARKAHHKATQRRKQAKVQCMKVAMDPELKKYVTHHITEHQSPEGISLRLKNVDTHLPYASTKAIYKFVYSPHGRCIERHLHSKAVAKKPGRKRDTATVWDDGRVSIEKRPHKVENRREFGHWEGDFIESGKDGTGSLLVLVERKTRYVFLRYVSDRSADGVNALVEEMLADVPVRSVTIDNDVSFKKHETLSEMIGADIFFCHPQCSHEKGGVENRNKAARRYVKKRTDISQYSAKYIQYVEEKLREKFMVCLNGRSPQEAWDAEMEKHRAKILKTKTAAGRREITRNGVRLQG